MSNGASDSNGKKPIFNDRLWIKFIEWSCVIIISIFGFVFTVKGLAEDVKEIKPIVNQHDKAIAVIQNDLSYIKSGVDEIKRAMR